MICREAQRSIHGTSQKFVQPSIHGVPDAREEPIHHIGRCPIRSMQVRQVVWQYQERFGQRDQKHADNDHRQCGPHFPDAPGNEEQGRERRHRSEHREDQRLLDPPRAPDRRNKSRHAPLAFVVNVFGHDNGVVDDDADRQEKREQGNGIDRQTEPQHDGQSPDA